MAIKLISLEVIIPLAVVWFILGAPGLDKVTDTFSFGSPSSADIGRNHTLSIDPKHFIHTAWEASCPEHHYVSYLFSRDPLVVYLENFLSPSEADTIMEATESSLKTAKIGAKSGAFGVDSRVRNSTTSPLPTSHQLSHCIAQRSLSFQGWPADTYLEQLWAQKYVAPYGHYSHHFDWAAPGKDRANTGGRQSSFMVYLQGEESGVKGGGTNFPRLDMPATGRGGDWCKFVDCSKETRESHEGVTFKALKGNAVFWENFRSTDGSLVEKSYHAGLPVNEGEKWGLNIWTWWIPGWKGESTVAPGEATDSKEL